MLQKPSESPWFCSECMNTNSFTHGSSTKRIGSQLSCVYLNARSIFPSILTSLHIFAATKRILLLSQRLFGSSISDAEIYPSTYLTFLHDRSRHGGWVLICICDSLQVAPRQVLRNQFDKLLWLEICNCAGPGVFIVLQVKVFITFQYPVILCGDFNMPSINCSISIVTVS